MSVKSSLLCGTIAATTLIGFGSRIPVAAQQKPAARNVTMHTARGTLKAAHVTKRGNTMVMDDVTFTSKKDRAGHRAVSHFRRLTITPNTVPSR
jgi:hypothetical protein